MALRSVAVSATILILAVWAVAQTGAAANPVIAFPIASAPELIGLILLVMLLNALFVAGETAADLLKPMHVKHLRDRDERHADRLQVVLDSRLTFVAACRLGSDLSRLLLFLIILALAPGVTKALGFDLTYPDVLATAFLLMIPVGLLNLVFELVPRSYAALHPHGTAIRLFGFLRVAALLFSLPARMVTGLANLITTRFGGRASFVIANQAEEEIKTIVESAQESGEIEVDEKELLHSVFEFTDTVAREVMTPRVDIDALPVSSTPEQVMELIRSTGHSRIPLYEQTDDQIVGIVHAKDLFMAMLSPVLSTSAVVNVHDRGDQSEINRKSEIESRKSLSLRDLMRPAIFVPENKNLHDLLAEMRLYRTQMVVVQDEFGGTAGIVTIEDIVEELVGDIVDEYDVEEPEVVAVHDGWVADGKTHIDDLNDEIGAEFSSDEFDTVGGLVFGLFGRQPKQGESIEAEGYRFTVSETDGRRILKLHIEKLPEEAELQHAEQD